MSEAEVLYRVGPPDHETPYYGHHHELTGKIWYYIPDGDFSGDWFTEINFGSRGRIRDLRRFKPPR